MLPGCCPGQLLFCDSSGNLDVQQSHLSLVAQIRLAGKAAVMAQRKDVHQGYPCLPGDVSALLLVCSPNRGDEVSVLVLEALMRSEMVARDSQEMFLKPPAN